MVEQGVAAGAAALEPIAYPPRPIARRPTFPLATVAAILKRDRFCCRYCGRKTIPTPIMALLGVLYPQSFPFHPNWKGGVTHPAVITRSPVIDHVSPGAWGGDWNASDNLVTACWPCNAVKADLSLDQLGWPPPRRIPDTEWDGLTSLYRRLWVATGSPEVGDHRRWLVALGC